MESEIVQQSLDSNENMDHLRTLEKDLISKRMKCQKEIDRFTHTRDDLLTRSSNGRKRKANSRRFASVEKNLKELKLEYSKIVSDISDLSKKMDCISQLPENSGQCQHIEKLITIIDDAIVDDRPVDNNILLQFRSLINGMRNDQIKVENELADQKCVLETHISEKLAAQQQIASLEEKLKTKELLSVSLHEIGISQQDMLNEMQNFEKAQLNNQELSKKIKCCEEEIALLKATVIEMNSQLEGSHNTIMSLREDLEACETENKEIADKWSKDIADKELYKNKLQLLQRELSNV